MTKKYVLFMIDRHEPEGGMDDIFGSFDTIGECMDSVTAYNYHAYQIVDASTWQIVKKGEC